MKQNMAFGLFMAALLACPALCADEANAENAKESKPGARELLSKVWVTDPIWAARDVEGEEWYDPGNCRNANAAEFLMPPDRDGQIFKTAAAWKISSGGRDNHRTFAFRVPVDDNKYLMEPGEFPERVKKILERDLNVFVNKNGPKPKLSLLEGVGKATGNSISLHIRLDNSEHILGFENSTQLISKRYMVVDGRFFYLGVKGRTIKESEADAIDRKVRERAERNEWYLDMWERDIRRATLAHRLSEHGGDVKAAGKAIDAEVAADKARLEADIEKRRKEFFEGRGRRSVEGNSVPGLEASSGNRKSPETAQKDVPSGTDRRGARRVRGVGGLVAEAIPIPDEGKKSIAVGLFAFFAAIFILVALLNIMARTPGGRRHSSGERGDNGGKTISKSKEPDKNRCWICGAPCHDYDRHPVEMWGNHESCAERGWGGRKVHHTWNTVEIDIPCCAECEEEIEASSSVRNKVSAIAGLSVFAVVGGGVFLLHSGPDIDDRLCWSIASALFSGLFVMVLGFVKGGHKYWSRIVEFPAISALTDKGWKFGSKPTFVN